MNLIFVNSLKNGEIGLENRITWNYGSRLGLIGIRSLDSSNNPKTRRVYSHMFIVDIEKKKKKKKNIK